MKRNSSPALRRLEQSDCNTSQDFSLEPAPEDEASPVPFCSLVVALWCGAGAAALYESGMRARICSGLLASVLVALGHAALPFSPCTLCRSALWRVVSRFALLYLMLLTFVLFQDISDVHAGLGIIDPSVGRPLPEKSYAEVCELYTPDSPDGAFANIWDRVDVFITAHALGWLGKAFIIRDVGLLWVSSLLFECTEITFKHLLPNFIECWWDHLFLDTFGCNMIGIHGGLLLLSFLGAKKYHWFGQGEAGYLNSIWGVDRRRLLGVLALLFVANQVDLNFFFMKNLLWLPTAHWICVIRTFAWAFFCFSGVRDLHEFAGDLGRAGRGCGEQMVLNILVLLAELALILKFSRGAFEASMPVWIMSSWAAVFALLSARVAFAPLLDANRLKVD